MEQDKEEERQCFINIFKKISNESSTASKLIWVLIGKYLYKSERDTYNGNIEKSCLNLADYKALLPYPTMNYRSIKGADELKVYLNLESDLRIIKMAIDDGIQESKEKTECSYIVFEGIKFTFPKWFLDYIKDNPFKAIIE